MMEIERLIAVWSTREEMQDLPTLETPVGFSTASGVWAPCQTHKSREWLPSGKETLFLPMINYLHSVDRSWSYSRRSWDVPNPSESQAVQPDTGQVSPGGVFPAHTHTILNNYCIGQVHCFLFVLRDKEGVKWGKGNIDNMWLRSPAPYQNPTCDLSGPTIHN